MEQTQYNSIQLIDGVGNFKMADAERFQRMSNIDAFKRLYGVISVMGPQSVGKSTLLNNMFDTNFAEMNELKRRSQTTQGVWMAVHSSSSVPIIVLDVEGSDGRERGENTLFERQSALFNLAVSDVVLINIWKMEVGREYGAGKPLLRTIFQVMKRLFNKPQKTTLMFVIRDKDRTPLSNLEEILTKDTKELWNQVHQDTPMDRFFNVEVKALSSYQSHPDQFKQEVADLKAHLITIITSKRFAGKGQDVEHASEFFRSTEETWEKIKGNEDLDIPAQRVMLAHTRCAASSKTNWDSFNNNKDWCALQNSVQSGRATHFGSIINPLLRASIRDYEDKTKYFDKDIRESHGASLKRSLLQAVHPAWGSFIRHIQARTLDEYKEALNKALRSGKTTFTVAASNCAQTSLASFDAKSSELSIAFADWNASHVREELRRNIYQHNASLSSSKLSTLISNQEGYLIGNLRVELESLLSDVGKNSWQMIRELIERRIETCVSEINGDIVSYGLSEETDGVRTNLRQIVKSETESKVRAKLSQVPTLMKQRFDKLFIPKSSKGKWKDVDNIRAIKNAAYSSALELLSFYTAIRWEDDQYDTIRRTLFAALLESPATSAYMLNSNFWQDVPESRTLITPVSCKSYWEQFESKTIEAVKKAEKQRVTVADLKAHLIRNITSKRDAGKGQDVEHASEFFRSTEETWKKIKGNEDLDIPAQRVMLAHTRCAASSKTNWDSFNNNKDWCALQNSVQSGRATHFGSIINPLLRASIRDYEDKTKYFDKDIRESHGAMLKRSLLQAVHPAWGSFLGHIQARTLDEYKEALIKALQHGKTTFTVAASHCAQTSLASFDAKSSELSIAFADWNASHVREELRRNIDQHNASLSSSELSILTSYQEGYLIGNLRVELESLLSDVGKNSWQMIRELIEHRIETCVSEINGDLVSYGLSEETDGVRTNLRQIAKSETESKVRAKLSQVPTLMKQRFDKLFIPKSSKGKWKDVDDIPEITNAAYSSALELLSFYTAIRWEDDHYDTIRRTLFAALLESPATSAYMLNSNFWQDVPESRTLITPVSCKSYWEQFESKTIEAVKKAVKQRDTVEAETIKRSTEHAFPHLVPSAGRLGSRRKDAEGAHGRSELGMNLKRSIKEGVVRISALINEVTTKRLGIYGQGGIGKTSVLRALITNPETANRFDLIIFVTVSRNWNTRKIQVEIARQLQLHLDGMETDGQIAGKLFESLEGQRFLLILDDVWELIDFDAVGVPEPSKEVGCRILIASRSLEVCQEMVTDKEIELKGISNEEAWELFHVELDELIDAPDIYPLAVALIEECAGLPLIIIVTGKALRNETDAEVWKHALESFRSSESVLPRLKFSYDRLYPLERRFFLYGALYPEDQEVNVCNLVDCCIEEGFILGESEDAHSKGHEIVNFLENAGFLEIQAGGVSVKMHDMMKDLASWILSCDVEGCQFLIGTDFRMRQPTDEVSSSLSVLPSNSGLRTLSFLNNGEILLRAGAADRRQPTEEEWKKASMMYLMDNEVSTLPKCPYSPNLRVLFLQRNYSIRVIPTSFFELMPFLQVLNLSRTRIKSLPRSFYNLISLRVLILRDCERFFMLPADVGSLIKLEILDLQGTNISRLPDAVGQLSCLKQLKASFYGSDNNSDYLKLAPDLIPRKVMSRLPTLEKLGIFVYPGDRRWDKRIEPLLQEVANLSQLTALSLSFPETDLLELFLQVSIAWQSKRMNTFNFVVGHDVNRIVARVSADVEFVHEKQERCLRYVNGDGITPDAVSEVLKRSTAFYLDHHLNIISLSEFGISNIKWLKVCVVSQCPEIQTIIDCKDRGGAILPSLERLSIHYLWNLRRIWREAVPSGSFRSLKILSVYSCPRLKYVFSYSMLQYAHNLEELVVEDCPEVTEVIVEDEGAASSDKPSTSLKRLTLHHLPELVSVWKGPWPLLEHISMFNCCKLKKIGLDSKLRYTIKEIKAEKDWWDKLDDWKEEEDLSSHLQSCFTPISYDDL